MRIAESKNASTNSHSSSSAASNINTTKTFSQAFDIDDSFITPPQIQNKIIISQSQHRLIDNTHQDIQQAFTKIIRPKSNFQIQKKPESNNDNILQLSEENVKEMQINYRSIINGNRTPLNDHIQTKGTKTNVSEFPSVIQLNKSDTQGESLPSDCKRDFNSTFGPVLNSVKIHTDTEAVQMNKELHSKAFTYGSHIYFNSGKFNNTAEGKHLLAHELTHVVQQKGETFNNRSNGLIQMEEEESSATPLDTSVLTSDAEAPESDPVTRQFDTLLPIREGALADRIPVSVNALGADADTDEPLTVYASRALGVDIRVSSLEDLTSQLERIASGRNCIQSLTIWHHGSPETQLINGMYLIRPRDRGHGTPRAPYRLAEEGFTTEWLTQSSNQTILNRLRNVFCCNSRMIWIGCSTAGADASGGIRTRQEQEEMPGRSLRHPSGYTDSEDAERHGASLYGATFGDINVQLWANALCLDILSSRDFVNLNPDDPNFHISVPDSNWFIASPEADQRCSCNESAGQRTGSAPSREQTVLANQRLTLEHLGSLDLTWHLLLRTFRRYLPAIAPPNIIPGWGYEEQSGTRPISPGTFQSVVQDDLRSRPRGRTALNAINVFRELLMHAARSLSPPSPLPNIAFDGEHRPFLIIAEGNYAYSAATFPHLAICYPDNFWRWIMFNDNAIQQTPEYTRSIILHELHHAADIMQSLNEFQRLRGAVPSLPSSQLRTRCQPINEGIRQSWTDPWGVYVNEFIDFYNGNQSINRHLEIVADQHNMDIEHWSAAEKIYWIRSVLDHIPTDFPSESILPGESEILNLYQQSNESLQESIVTEFSEFFNDIISAERSIGSGSGTLTLDETSSEESRSSLSIAEQRQHLSALRRRGRTILNRFSPIIERVIRDHFYGQRRFLDLIVRE